MKILTEASHLKLVMVLPTRETTRGCGENWILNDQIATETVQKENGTRSGKQHWNNNKCSLLRIETRKWARKQYKIHTFELCAWEEIKHSVNLLNCKLFRALLRWLFSFPLLPVTVWRFMFFLSLSVSLLLFFFSFSSLVSFYWPCAFDINTF